MQKSSVLNGIAAIQTNENQFNIALAQTVKEVLEGILVPGQVWVNATHAMAEKYGLGELEIVTLPMEEPYVLEGNVLKLNVDLNKPTAGDYLTITEGIGAYLKPDAKYRPELRGAGNNWVTDYGNQMYKLFLSQPDQRLPLCQSLATGFHTLLTSAHSAMVDQYTDRNAFINDFANEASAAPNLYQAVQDGLFKVIFDDDRATKFAQVYSNIRYADNKTGVKASPSSAEFMSMYLFECLGAI